MRLHQWTSTRVRKGIAFVLMLAFSSALISFVSSSEVAAQTPDKVEASIFTYDGHDLVRTTTTLVTEDGKSAVNTKLDHGSPAYDALMHKHSYTGNVTVFGHKYAASYAPLIDKDGKLTGALFVGVAK